MHRIIVNCETGEVSQVQYTAEEQAEYDAAIAAQAAEVVEVVPPVKGA